MTFTAPLERHDYEDATYMYVMVPEEIVEKLSGGKQTRVQVTLHGKISYHCQMTSMGNGAGFYVSINKTNRSKLGLVLGQPVEVSIKKDDSKYGAEMPQEFSEVLNQDPEGDELFHQLTKGAQRSIIYWVGRVKNPDLRIRRALLAMDHIREHKKVDQMLLNQALKATKRF